MSDDKARENRLRRMAHRQGLRLFRSRTRTPEAVDFGGYGLTEEWNNAVVFGLGLTPDGASLDEVEAYLTQE